jgi:hypothetical protein
VESLGVEGSLTPDAGADRKGEDRKPVGRFRRERPVAVLGLFEPDAPKPPFNVLAQRRPKAVRWSEGLGRMGIDMLPALQRSQAMAFALSLREPPERSVPEHSLMCPIAWLLTVKLVLSGDGRPVCPRLIDATDALFSSDAEVAHHFFDDVAHVGQGFVIRGKAEVRWCYGKNVRLSSQLRCLPRASASFLDLFE